MEGRDQLLVLRWLKDLEWTAVLNMVVYMTVL
jgi:hypothetical protein